MDEKTQTPELTPAHLRAGGILMVIATAAVPPLAWTFAMSQVSLFGLFVGASAWAAIALAGYLALGRTADSRRFALLVCGCGALWTIVLSTAFWFVVRGEFNGESAVSLTVGKLQPSEVMALVGLATAATGAIYGFFCGIRYREIPRSFSRTVRASAWAALPGVILCLVVFGFAVPNRYEAMVVLAPFALALALTAIARLIPRPATTPAGIS